MKICVKCKIEKSLTDFSKGNGVDGLFCWCKDCHHEYGRTNKIRIKSRAHARYEKNKEAISKKLKEYYETHRVEIIEKQKIYQETHKEERKLYLKQNNETIRAYVRNKRKNDINFRLTGSLRNRVRKAVKGINKSKSTLELIGCSIEELKQYLEKHFQLGMNWDNYNYRGWHIDHIRPCASFDLNKPEEQRKCFHFTNLQPMWRKENQKKGSKYDTASQ